MSFTRMFRGTILPVLRRRVDRAAPALGPRASQCPRRAFSGSKEDADTPETKEFDTSFLRKSFQDEGYDISEAVTFESAMAPYRPENWEELLAEADASYPERAGPRRNRRKTRERNRRRVIQEQHRVRKAQTIDAHFRRQGAIQRELDDMREAYFSFGFTPALEYVKASGDGSSAGLGGRLPERYFGPLLRTRELEPVRPSKAAAMAGAAEKVEAGST